MNSLRKFLFIDPVLPDHKPLFNSCTEIVRVYEERPNGVILTKRKITAFMRGVSFSPKNSPAIKKGLSWAIDTKLVATRVVKSEIRKLIQNKFELVFDDWDKTIQRRAADAMALTRQRSRYRSFMQSISYGSYTSVVVEKNEPSDRIDLYLNNGVNIPLLQYEYLMRISEEVFIYMPTQIYLIPLVERIIDSVENTLVLKRTRILSLQKDNAEKFFDEYGIWWNEKKLTIAREPLEIRHTEKWLGDKIIIVARPRRRTWYDEFSFRYEDKNIFKHEQNNKPYVPELMETYSHAKIYTKPNLY
jgi:hypothetical protein